MIEGYYHEEPGEFLPYFGTPLDKLFGDLEGVKNYCTPSTYRYALTKPAWKWNYYVIVV